jgi:hypothetical protein
MPFVPLLVVPGTENGKPLDIPVNRISCGYVFPDRPEINLTWFKLGERHRFVVKGEPCARLQDFLRQHFTLIGHTWAHPASVHSVRRKKKTARLGFGPFAIDTEGVSPDQVDDLVDLAGLQPVGNQLFVSPTHAMLYRRDGQLYGMGRGVSVREAHQEEWELSSQDWLPAAHGTSNHAWFNPRQIRSLYQGRLFLSSILSVPLETLSAEVRAQVDKLPWVDAPDGQRFNLDRVEMVGSSKDSGPMGCVFLGNGISISIPSETLPGIIARLNHIHGDWSEGG